MLKFVIAAAFLCCGCSSFTRPEPAEKFLETQGYTHIQITGYRWFICDDQFATGFEAISPAGIEVSGAVCQGWNTGEYLRLDDNNQ